MGMPARGDLLAPLRVRDFRLLIGGQMVSTAGDMFYAVALPWLVLSGTGDAQALGVVLAAYSVPRVGTIILGGWLSDRLRPRRVMLGADLCRAVLVAMLAALAFAAHPALWALIAVAAPLGACEGLFLPASYAIMPEILDERDLHAGNAVNTSALQAANLIGPGIGGVIVGVFHAGTALAVDAATFAVSAAALLAMRSGRHRAAPAAETAATGDDPRLRMTFWQIVRSWRLLQVALVIVIAGNLFIGGLMWVAIPALAHGPLHAGAGGYGAMLAAFGGGTLAGGLVAGTLGRLPHQARAILLLTLGQAAGITALPFAPGLIGAVGVLAVTGLVTGLTNVLFLSLVQTQAPRDLLGRIMGVFVFATFSLYPISVLLAGAMVRRFGPTPMFPLTGIAIAGAVAFGLAQREIWDMA